MAIRGIKRKVICEFLEKWDGALEKRDIFLKENRIGVRVFNAYRMEWKAREDTGRLSQEIERIKGFIDKKLKIPETESEQVVRVLDVLYELAIEKKNWQAAKAFLQAKGVFIEKREDIIKINADDYFRAREEAIRRDGGSGKVSGHSILPDQIWEGAGHVEGDNTVGAVEASSEVS